MKPDKTILLVEDNPSDIELTKRAFEKNRLVNPMDVVQDGEEALEYLFGTGRHANRDPRKLPSVVLLDLKLPKVDGFEVLRRIRKDERTQFLPIVILTTSKEQQDLVEGYRLGANSYVRKPISFGEFCEAVARLGVYWLLVNEPPPTK